MATNQIHLLQSLRLPSRYESLSAAVGDDVARILVEPSAETISVFRSAADFIGARGRGVFIPLFAPSGTGKTTLVSNVGGWLPSLYTPTARVRGGGELSLERLRGAVASLVRDRALPANEGRVIPINVDDRESDPPTERELAQIKAFLREEPHGSRSLVVWPETSRTHAEEMGTQYQARAGKSPIELPFTVHGPSPLTWDQIAIETLKLTNRMHNLEMLGVDGDCPDSG